MTDTTKPVEPVARIWVRFSNWRNDNHGAAYRNKMSGYDTYVPATALDAANAEIERLTRWRNHYKQAWKIQFERANKAESAALEAYGDSKVREGWEAGMKEAATLLEEDMTAWVARSAILAAIRDKQP